MPKNLEVHAEAELEGAESIAVQRAQVLGPDEAQRLGEQRRRHPELDPGGSPRGAQVHGLALGPDVARVGEGHQPQDVVEERLRQADQAGESEFRGLYVSEGDVDTILAGSSLIPSGGSPQPDDASYQILVESQRQFETGIAERKDESLRRGLVLRLHELQQSFRLSEFDIDILLIGVLPELDLRYQRLYAYLQDDVTRKNPSVELVLYFWKH